MNDKLPPLEPGLLDRFAAIVGDRYALRGEADIAPYLVEPRGLWHGSTPLVLRPGSVEEVSRIMRLATETGTPIVPQSGNTGLVGAQVPDRSGRDVASDRESTSTSAASSMRAIAPVSASRNVSSEPARSTRSRNGSPVSPASGV